MKKTTKKRAIKKTTATTTRKRRKPLPKKLSALLRLAVADAQAVEKLDGYTLDMGSWHMPAGHESNPTPSKCSVCMAGAVMVRTLKAPRSRLVYPDKFRGVAADRLGAINDMRIGDMSLAHAKVSGEYLHHDDPKFAPAKALIVKYFDHNIDRAPWPAYELAAIELERLGL